MRINSNWKLRSFYFVYLGMLIPINSWALDNTGTVDPRKPNFAESLFSKKYTGFENLDRLRTAYRDLQAYPDLRNTLLDSNVNTITINQRILGPSNIDSTKFQHYYKGIEVIGSMAIHHATPDGTYIRNRIERFDISTVPTISSKTAAAIAQEHSYGMDLKKPPYLAILPSPQEGSAKLIYWVTLQGAGIGGGEDILVDAHSGRVLAELSHNHSLAKVQIYSARHQGVKVTPQIILDPVTYVKKVKDCSMTSISSGESTPLSLDSCRAIYQGLSSLTEGQCQVVDGMRGFPIDVNPVACKQVVTDDTIGDSLDPAVVRASMNSNRVLEYFRVRFGRDSYDNRGSDLVSVIHAGEKMANAFWRTDLNVMVYGEGNGTSIADLTGSIDVAGHEMTHGVTTQTANLMMMGESGALNEAFSDYFGKMIEAENDWVVGKGLFLDSSRPKGIRNLKDPHQLKSVVRDLEGIHERPYPAHVREQAAVSTDIGCDGSNDRCHVHYNSTIPGHASYLVHEALGAEKAQLLYYTALTQNLTPTDNFKTAAAAILSTCGHLNFSKSDCDLVKTAYERVGIL